MELVAFPAMGSALYRRAEIADADRIRSLMEEVNREGLSWLRGPATIDPVEFRETFERTLTAPLSTVAVAVVGSEVVAIGFCEPRGDAHCDVTIQVSPAHRRMGHAERLLRHLVDWANAEPGLERLYAKVIETNAASIALCRKLGFVEDYDRGRRIERVGDKDIPVFHLYRDCAG